MSLRRGLRTGAAWAGLAAFGWCAWQVFAAELDPEGHAGPWTLGPDPEALNRVAEARLERALEGLRDDETPIASRLEAYDRQLDSAAVLLARSLRARPNQAPVLARLAAIRHERGGTAEPLMDLAAGLSERRPGVQLDLAGLALQMRQEPRAARLLAAALDTEPQRAGEVVALLGSRGYRADAILELLPARADLLAALMPQYRAEGRLDAYRKRLERELDPDHPGLVTAFGEAAMATGEAALLVARLEALAPRESPVAEAARQTWLSHGYLAQGRPTDALTAADAAVTLRPRSIPQRIHLGDVAHAVGKPAGPAGGETLERSRLAYRTALDLLARTSNSSRRRAQVYGKIARTHESEGRLDLAYEAFKLSLRVDPSEPYARRRVAELEAAAGRDGG